VIAASESATTGAEVFRSGAAAAVFAVIGFLWMRFGIPPLSRLMGFGSWWYDSRAARIWNYGLLGIVGGCGVVAMAVGAVAWAIGTTFH